MTYFGNVNPDLLELVPLTARRVLELGCGEGAFAAAYRSRNPKAHYSAVELHGASAEQAATRVDRLLCGDFETMDDADVTGGTPFDLIVMGDVLEHMSDPDRVLTRLRDLLADDGHLAISVPNVAHWTALFHLINGHWPAQDSGLFDRTHLRFFTRESALALAAPSRLKVERWLRYMPPNLSKLGLANLLTLGLARDLIATQYLIASTHKG